MRVSGAILKCAFTCSVSTGSSNDAVAYVSIRQHTSAYVSMRQHTSDYGAPSLAACPQARQTTLKKCQHMSAYVSIRQQRSAYGDIVTGVQKCSVTTLNMYTKYIYIIYIYRLPKRRSVDSVVELL
jgi:hypothetical protein